MTNLKNIAVAVASIVIFTSITQAQTTVANYPVNYAEPLKVKYLGEEGDYLRFEVTYEWETPGKARFSIEDKNSDELYAAFFKNTYKVQIIKIEKNAYSTLKFNLVAGKKTYSKLFSVNTSMVFTTTVAERDVTKL